MVMPVIIAIRRIAYSRSPGCQMWYQRVTETTPPEFASTTVQDRQQSTSSSRQRQWVDDEEPEDSPAQFRRVRLRCGREFPDQRDPVTEIEVPRGVPEYPSNHKEERRPR